MTKISKHVQRLEAIVSRLDLSAAEKTRLTKDVSPEQAELLTEAIESHSPKSRPYQLRHDYQHKNQYR